MAPYARERVKKAHKGRETRGVLAKSTSRTVGASTCSILMFFLSTLIFLVPLLGSLLCFVTISCTSGRPWHSLLVVSSASLRGVDPVALASSIYVYWTLLCTYLLYLRRPNALNVVKYQTFRIPWSFRRDHVSHMRLDRLQRVWGPSNPTSRRKARPEQKSAKRLFTVFVDIAAATTIALNIRKALRRRGHSLYNFQGPLYLMGLMRPLRCWVVQTVRVINLGTRLSANPNVAGDLAVNTDGVVVNDHGWEQGALNADGTLKMRMKWTLVRILAPGQHQFLRGTIYQALLQAGALVDSDDEDQGSKKPKRVTGNKRKRGAKSVKGKEKETASDAADSSFPTDDEEDSADSDAEAKITNEESARGADPADQKRKS
ncbi:hypothetical protein B0H10DRAFT_1965738 [Mycena sp. CBHHK59/15]|nr:hypothetical protein B0H10DRAFT_1965738 [Mycena sp. CBHHK59/15]